jgi:G:T-mismatch repair DNA endonuclease (very short patch repair protein)
MVDRHPSQSAPTGQFRLYDAAAANEWRRLYRWEVNHLRGPAHIDEANWPGDAFRQYKESGAAAKFGPTGTYRECDAISRACEVVTDSWSQALGAARPELARRGPTNSEWGEFGWLSEFHLQELMLGTWEPNPVFRPAAFAANRHEQIASWLRAAVRRTRPGRDLDDVVESDPCGKSLAQGRPDLAAQWHLEFNGPLTPDQVPVEYDEEAWWLCPVAPDHVWHATVYERAFVRDRGCPACAGRQHSVTNSLAALHPDWVYLWHPTLNGDLTPDTCFGSGGVWWRCPAGHDWQSPSFLDETPWCVECYLARTSLVATNETLAAEWHPTLNGDLTPDRVSILDGRQAWWLCDQGHAWRSGVPGRVSRPRACPKCAPARLAAKLISGRIFHSKLEARAEALLASYGFARQRPYLERHRFDYGHTSRAEVVEINGCRYHDHRVIKPECPTRAAAYLTTHGTYAENDVRIRGIAARHGIALLELWECEESQWPDQMAAFVDSRAEEDDGLALTA